MPYLSTRPTTHGADGETAMNDGARQTTVVVKLDGLPELIVTGEPWEPEFDIGIDHWTVVDLDWRGAHGALTPEQDVAALAHSRELEDAVVEAFHERRAAERSARAAG